MSLLEFRRIVRRNGLSVTEEQLDLLGRYVELLLEWNGKINLISRRDQENVWFSQMLHSVSAWFFVELDQGLRVLDLGTGGGLPGIPLAILRPDLNLTLLDSIRKKVDAVGNMVGVLGLKNAQVVVGRAEDIGWESSHRYSYDVVLARAVARLADVAKWSKAFLRRGDGSGAPKRAFSVLGDLPGGIDSVTREEKREGADGNSRGRISIHGPCLLTLKGGDLEREVHEATVKGARVQMVPLVFPGGEQIGLEDKKLLIVTVR